MLTWDTEADARDRDPFHCRILHTLDGQVKERVSKTYEKHMPEDALIKRQQKIRCVP